MAREHPALRGTCRHESGHYVISQRVGFAVAYVEIEDRGNRLGCVGFTPATQRRVVAALERLTEAAIYFALPRAADADVVDRALLVSMAGPLAEIAGAARGEFELQTAPLPATAARRRAVIEHLDEPTGPSDLEWIRETLRNLTLGARPRRSCGSRCWSSGRKACC